MADKKAVFTRIVLTLGADPSLIVEGSFTQAELDPLIDRWVGLLQPGATAAQEAAFAASLKEGTAKLAAAEQADAASHS